LKTIVDGGKKKLLSFDNQKHRNICERGMQENIVQVPLYFCIEGA
jgi:hypothetical protein